MPDFFFDLPLWISGLLIIGSLCLYAGFGLRIVDRYILSHLRMHPEDNVFNAGMVGAVMVFYGLAVALIAINVWERYSDVSTIISQEASSMSALYRDVESYPEPIRPQLQQILSDYTDYIIHKAWPMQAQGQIPAGGEKLMNQFQTLLKNYKPSTDEQRILDAETLHKYNQVIEANRLRLDAVGTKLPGIMWFIIIIGALISLFSSFFFKVEDIRLHLIQVVLVAVFIGMIIFLIIALDSPFRGDLALSSEPYQIIYDELMR